MPKRWLILFYCKLSLGCTLFCNFDGVFGYLYLHELFQVPVGHPDEIDEIFDAISYSKGASVIRMLHNFIGDKVS